jgi:hypothetical protein
MKCANKYVNGFVYAKLESIWNTKQEVQYYVEIVRWTIVDKIKNNELPLFLFIELCHWSFHQSIAQESFSNNFKICLSWTNKKWWQMNLYKKGWNLRIIDEKYMFMDEKIKIYHMSFYKFFFKN